MFKVSRHYEDTCEHADDASLRLLSRSVLYWTQGHPSCGAWRRTVGLKVLEAALDDGCFKDGLVPAGIRPLPFSADELCGHVLYETLGRDPCPAQIHNSNISFYGRSLPHHSALKRPLGLLPNISVVRWDFIDVVLLCSVARPLRVKTDEIAAPCVDARLTVVGNWCASCVLDG